MRDATDPPYVPPTPKPPDTLRCNVHIRACGHPCVEAKHDGKMANAGKPVRVYEVAEGLAAQGVKVGKANLSTILRRLAAAHPQHIKISKNGRNLLYAYIGSSGSAMSS